MTNETKNKIRIANINGVEKLYIDGFIVLDKISSVYYNGAIYQARNNEIVTNAGKYSIASLVEKGYDVWYLS